MSEMTSQITDPSIVCSTVSSSTGQRKHQSSASLAFVTGIHRLLVGPPHKATSNTENVSIWWRHHDFFFLNPGLDGYHAILKDCQYWNCLWMIAWSLHGITQQYANEAFSHVFVKKCPCTNSVCCHHHQVSKITHGKNGFLDVVSQSQIKSNECFSIQSSWCFCHGTHSSSCTYKRSRPYFTRPWRRPLWDIST